MAIKDDVLGAAARAVNDAARSGQGMRASVKGLTYGLAGNASIAAQVTAVSIETKSYDALVVENSATPVTVVAEGAEKPLAVTTTTASVDLVKHAGYAKVSLESLVFYDEARRVIVDVLWRQAVRSMDLAIVTAMTAAADAVTTTATTASGRIIDGFAHLVDNGADPSAVVLNPSDWAAVIGANDGGAWLNMRNSENGPAGTFMGAALVPASAVPKGTGFVFDSSAVVAAHLADNPYLFLSPMDTRNQATLILDLIASPLVTLPAGVVKVALAA